MEDKKKLHVEMRRKWSEETDWDDYWDEIFVNGEYVGNAFSFSEILMCVLDYLGYTIEIK